MDLFSHNELIAMESLIGEDIRTDDMDPSDYDGDATEWSDVRWDQVTDDYDEDMIYDIVSTFQFINDSYVSNSTVYDMIINKLKPYFVSSNLLVTEGTKIYVVAG